MWLNDFITVGTRVARADNERHEGKVVAVFNSAPGFAGRTAAWLAAATFRVEWANGWREDCARTELRRIG